MNPTEPLAALVALLTADTERETLELLAPILADDRRRTAELLELLEPEGVNR